MTAERRGHHEDVGVGQVVRGRSAEESHPAILASAPDGSRRTWTGARADDSPAGPGSGEPVVEVFSGCWAFVLPIVVAAHCRCRCSACCSASPGCAGRPARRRCAAAGVPPVSARTSRVVTADGLPTAQINGVVWTQVIVGDRRLRRRRVHPRPPGRRRPGTQRATALEPDLGQPDHRRAERFAPQFNGPVKALAVSTGRQDPVRRRQLHPGRLDARNRFAAFRISDRRPAAARDPSFNGDRRARITP